MNQNFGIGFKYNTWLKKTSSNSSFSNSFGTIYISTENRVVLNYFGPSIHLIAPFQNNTTFFYTTLSPGVAFYKRTKRSSDSGTKVTLGNCFALHVNSGFDFRVQKNMYIGFQFGLSHGLMSNVPVSGEEITLDSPISLFRFDFCLGSKLYF